MDRSRIIELILRIGVAFPFLYAPLNAVFDPYAWIDFFPQFMRGVVPDIVLLNVFGLFEVIIALWLLSGRKILMPSLLALFSLLAIVLFNLAGFQLLFRDLSIAAAAFALVVIHWPRTTVKNDYLKNTDSLTL